MSNDNDDDLAFPSSNATLRMIERIAQCWARDQGKTNRCVLPNDDLRNN